MKWLLLSAIAMIVLAPFAGAQVYRPEIDERVVSVQDPPVKLVNVCAGWAPPEWASDAHKAEEANLELLPIYMEVQNQTAKAIYAYRFTVVTYDPFGDYLDTMQATAITGLAPQATEKGRWRLRVRVPVLTTTTVIYLDAVRFQDGTAWRVDPVTVAAYFPGTAPVRFHSWHIIPDPREILGQAPKDPG